MAEGVFNKLALEDGLQDQVQAFSAGLSDACAGKPPDDRAQVAAEKKNYDLSGVRAKKLDPTQLRDYKLIVCMDQSHFDHLMTVCHPDDESKLKLLLYYTNDTEDEELEDPYTKDAEVFDETLHLIESSCRGLLDQLKAQVL